MKAPGFYAIDAFLRAMERGISMPRMAVIWCDGEWREDGQGFLAASDRGAILGLALFETMLAFDGGLKFATEHLARIDAASARLGWTFPGIDLETTARELLAKNGLVRGRARLRMTMTGGSGPIFDASRGKDARLWIAATPLDPAPEALDVTVSPWRRNARSPLAGLKTASYAENILALDHARRRGFSETIFFNTEGHLCEAATANVFLVKNGTLLTPDLPSGCLPGVARSIVLRLAENAGLSPAELTLTADDLAGADEIFLTSATRGPVPVSRLDGRRFPATPLSGIVRELWHDEICRA